MMPCRLGGGVQSTALALLALSRDQRLLDVTGGRVPELYIFADTGDEPADVMSNVEHIAGLIRESGAQFATVRHKAAPLSDHIITARRAEAPFYVARTQRPGAVPLKRKCTSDFKVVPIHRELRRFFGINSRRRTHPHRVRQWLGISHDEIQRTRISQDRWCDLFYPLVHMGWRRGDCLRLIEAHELTPVRSACRYCPFHSNREWARLKAQPDEWAQIVAFERRLHGVYEHDSMSLDSRPYLHASRIPIDRVDFDGDQADMWDMDNECAGLCGV